MPGRLIRFRHPLAICRIADDIRLDLQSRFPQHNALSLLQRRELITVGRANLAELDQPEGVACQRVEVTSMRFTCKFQGWPGKTRGSSSLLPNR